MGKDLSGFKNLADLKNNENTKQTKYKNKPLKCLTQNPKRMKTLKQILVVVVFMNLLMLSAQQRAYVAAESGLSLRDQPDVSGKMLSKLAYGEAIGILENTGIQLVVLDAGEKISGEWVKVETRNHIGYVFNGYLSADKIIKPIRFQLDKLNLEIQNLATSDYKRTHNLKQQDSVKINVDVNASPEGKQIVLANNDYKRVSIFQGYENRLLFISEASQCDSNDWKYFDSEWKPLKQLNSNTFETLTYSDKSWKTFIITAVEELKPDVIEQCGEAWLEYINGIESVENYPMSIDTIRILLKLILTDFEDNVTEKIIEFEIPNGC
jgi:hypothetical protein